MMKYLTTLLVATALFVGGCASFKEKSPFLCHTDECQELNHSVSLDVKRLIAAEFAVHKLMRNDPDGLRKSTEKLFSLAKWFDWAGNFEDMTGKQLNDAFVAVLARDDIHSEDRLLLAVFADEMKVLGPAIDLKLSPEKRRVLKLYADGIVASIASFVP